MSKKILIVDTSENCTELLKLLLENFSKYTPEIQSDYNTIISKYKNDKYEFIIFDHSCKISNNLIEHILSNNPTQKCILLSDSINCPVDCDTCKDSFKFIRLLKPIDAKSVLQYIEAKNQFACPNTNVFDSIDTLEKLFMFLNVENNTYLTKKELLKDKILISSSFGRSLRIDEMDKIEDNISKKYFKMNVLANNNIEIRKL